MSTFYFDKTEIYRISKQLQDVIAQVNQILDSDSGFAEGIQNLKVNIDNALVKIQSLETAIAALEATSEGIADKVNRSGDTMTGPLYLVADPSEDNEASTKHYVDVRDSLKVDKSSVGVPGGVATLNNLGVVSYDQLPGFVEQVEEYADIDDFPNPGNTEKLYVEITTKKTYRWTGTSYIEVGLSPVQSVNGKTGYVELTKDDLKLDRVDNTRDYEKSVFEALKLKEKRLINGTLFDGSGDIVTEYWGSERIFTIGEQTLAVDGSLDVTFTLDAIGAVKRSGDTMTGPLTLSGDPVENNHAVNKKYVDDTRDLLQSNIDNINTTVTQLNTDPVDKSYVDAELSKKADISGTVFTGEVTLANLPYEPMHAVPKQYVDVKINDIDLTITQLDSKKVNKTGDTLTGPLTLHGNPISALHAAPKQYVDSLNNVVNVRLNALESDVSTLKADPVTKTYVDNKVEERVKLTGSTMSGFLTLHADPALPMHAATKKYVDTVVSDKEAESISRDNALDTRINALTSVVNTLNTDPVDKSYVDAELAKKLDTSGGVLTGTLVLANDPVEDMEASTKRYVDNGLATKVDSSLLGVPDGVATLGSDGKVKPEQLPASVYDIIEVNTVSDLPEVGESGKLYITKDTNELYRWTGSQYLLTTASLGTSYVETVNGRSGNVVLTKDDVGLDKVDNTPDSAKEVLSARKLITNKQINGVVFDGTQDVTTTKWGASRQFTIGNKTISVNGENNVTYTLSDIGAVDKAGDSMTGFLSLHADPVTAMHAVNKRYVDSIKNSLDTELSTKISVDGGTITGELKLLHYPDEGVDAANKQYVDDKITYLDTYHKTILDKKADKTGDTFTGIVRLQYNIDDRTDPSVAVNKNYVDNRFSVAFNSMIDERDRLDGRIDQLQDTVVNLGVNKADKTYVDNRLNEKLDKTGGTLTGNLFINATPSDPKHAVTKQYVDNKLNYKADINHEHELEDLEGWPSNLDSGRLAFLSNVHSDVQTQLDNKLDKSGGDIAGNLTVAGHITVSAPPVSPSHLVNKQYVDQALANASSVPIGSIFGFPLGFNPGSLGFLSCNGAILKINDYPELFAVTGHSYTRRKITGNGKPEKFQYDMTSPLNTDDINDFIRYSTGPGAYYGYTSHVFKDKLYMIGGIDSSGKYTKDILVNYLDDDGNIEPTWYIQRNILDVNLAHHDSVIYDNFLYIIGGATDKNKVSNKIYRYQFNDDGSLTDMTIVADNKDIGAGCQAVICGDRLYVIGGSEDNDRKKTSDKIIYYIINIDGSLDGPYNSDEKLPMPLYRHAVGVMNDILIVCGGFTKKSSNQVRNGFYYRIENDNSLKYIGYFSLSYPMSDFKIMTGDNVFYTYGGIYRNNPRNVIYKYIFNPENNSTSVYKPSSITKTILPKSIGGHDIVMTKNHIYILPGFNSSTILRATVNGGYNDYSKMSDIVTSPDEFQLPDLTEQGDRAKVHFYIKAKNI